MELFERVKNALLVSFSHDANKSFILGNVPRYVDRPARWNLRLPTMVPFHLAPRPYGIKVDSFKVITNRRTEGTIHRHFAGIEDTTDFGVRFQLCRCAATVGSRTQFQIMHARPYLGVSRFRCPCEFSLLISAVAFCDVRFVALLSLGHHQT